jgi:hypothetical protein
MRSNLATLALAAGCLGGSAAAAVGTFFGMFYGLRLVCWLIHNDEYMLLMWLGIAVEPIAILVGFALGYRLVANMLGPPVGKPSQRGFDVLTGPPAQRDAG